MRGLLRSSTVFKYRYQAKGFRSFRYLSTEESASKPKVALVIGSSGALGSFVAHHLSTSLGMRVIGADVQELPHDFSEIWELDGFVKCPTGESLSDLTVELTKGVDFSLKQLQRDLSEEHLGVDAIICANGGWKGDPSYDEENSLIESLNEDEEALKRQERAVAEYANTVADMMQRNLFPVVAASQVAHYFCNPASLMVVVGAAAALGPTPGMMGYGLAKSATHHLIQTLGASTGQSLTPKSVRKAGRSARKDFPSLDDMHVVGILPTMIDTRANRKSNPKARFEDWTKPSDIAKEIGTWITRPATRPHSGSLVKVYPKDGSAQFELVR